MQSSGNRRSSVLSLNSIHKKKSIVKEKSTDLEDGDHLPKTAFTEAQFITLWNEYVVKLEKEGVRNLATIMKIDVPTIKNHRIQLIFPNEMMKSELMKMRHKLLRHFRSELNNHSIDFDITVNEEVSTKFAYTPEEKYHKLLEKNKALAELKKRFKLDL